MTLEEFTKSLSAFLAEKMSPEYLFMMIFVSSSEQGQHKMSTISSVGDSELEKAILETCKRRIEERDANQD